MSEKQKIHFWRTGDKPNITACRRKVTGDTLLYLSAKPTCKRCLPAWKQQQRELYGRASRCPSR